MLVKNIKGIRKSRDNYSALGVDTKILSHSLQYWNVKKKT